MRMQRQMEKFDNYHQIKNRDAIMKMLVNLGTIQMNKKVLANIFLSLKRETPDITCAT